MIDKYYLDFFRSVVVNGIKHGLQPIAWAVRYNKMCENERKKIEKYMPRFLHEIYSCTHNHYPDSADEILQWCDSHYTHDKKMHNYWGFLKSEIQEWINVY